MGKPKVDFIMNNDEKAHGVALAYAALKWGNNIVQEQGKILFHALPGVNFAVLLAGI
jgi:hypothetical protein